VCAVVVVRCPSWHYPSVSSARVHAAALVVAAWRRDGARARVCGSGNAKVAAQTPTCLRAETVTDGDAVLRGTPSALCGCAAAMQTLYPPAQDSGAASLRCLCADARRATALMMY
jgi:hypothetical protein